MNNASQLKMIVMLICLKKLPGMTSLSKAQS